MARQGRVDYRQLQRMQKKMEKLGNEYDKFCEAMARELAARLLAKVIKRTPVGQYDKEVNFTTKDGKKVSFTAGARVGGTLRRGWTTKSHSEAEGGAGNGGNASAYAKSLNVNKVGNTFELEIINPVEYASYVEFGHRTKNKQGWVNGRFMMTISADEVEQAAPAILEKKLMKLLREAFDGN